MNIDNELLFSWGAVAKKYSRTEFIFYDGDPARHYFQILEGKVKIFCYNEYGKVFTYGVYAPGNSFGEAPLFIDQKYPFYAVADTDCTVLILNKDTLFRILEKYPPLQIKFLKIFAGRIFEKTNISKHIISQNPEYRIISFLKKYKSDNQMDGRPSLIPYTRQEIADFTGLRVETVIRTVRKLFDENKLEIKNRKIYF